MMVKDIVLLSNFVQEDSEYVQQQFQTSSNSDVYTTSQWNWKMKNMHLMIVVW
jgi:hypothetical protein